MKNPQRWFWIPTVLLAALAVVFPAVLQAMPTGAPAPMTNTAPVVTVAATSIVPRTAPRGNQTERQRFYETTDADNLAMCTATGFAGGFTLFLAISGWGIFRTAMPRSFALGALLSSLAASGAGFMLGFTGFLQIVNY